MGIKDQLLKYYSENDHLLNHGGFHSFELNGRVYSSYRTDQNPFKCTHSLCMNTSSGIGDTLSVFHLAKHFKNTPERKCYISAPKFNPLFDQLIKYCPSYIQPKGEEDVHYLNEVDLVQKHLKMGNGHLFQRIQRAFKITPDLKPQADLYTGLSKKKGKVILNFHPGKFVIKQRVTLHPRARELYPEHRKTIQKFINENKNRYHFVEVSEWSSSFENVEDKTGLSIEESLKEVSTGEWYLGLHTGLMHIAAAFNLKSIVIINFPKAKHLYLPILKPYELIDKEWLYPQNVHLHEDEGGELVKKLSYKTLEQAFAGTLYPFFSNKYLDLIFSSKIK